MSDFERSEKKRNEKDAYMMQTKTINDIKIEAVKVPKQKKRDILGYDMFPVQYANIFITSRKNSGKSNLVYRIVENCTNRYTKVLIFAATVNKDPVYKKLIAKLNKRHIDVMTSTDFVVDGQDLLAEFMATNTEPADSSKKEAAEKLPLFPEPKEGKGKKQPPPNFLIILDDLGTECRHPSVAQLLKTNRHYHAKVIVSSQHATDLDPASRRQLDYILMLGGIPRDKLALIYNSGDFNVSLDDFIGLYLNATAEKYSFLYCDITGGMYRHNFSKLYQI